MLLGTEEGPGRGRRRRHGSTEDIDAYLHFLQLFHPAAVLNSKLDTFVSSDASTNMAFGEIVVDNVNLLDWSRADMCCSIVAGNTKEEGKVQGNTSIDLNT